MVATQALAPEGCEGSIRHLRLGGLLILTEPVVAFTPLSAFRGPKFAVTMGIILALMTAVLFLQESRRPTRR
jgi:hypothetical protein